MYSDSARYARKVNSVKTGNDIIRISTASNLVMFGTVEFVSKRCFQKYRGLWDQYSKLSIRFEISPIF